MSVSGSKPISAPAGFAACDGGSTGCLSVTLEFPDGETTLERSVLKSLRADAKDTLAKCPYVHVESYIADGDEETATMRKNHVKNLFSVVYREESKGRTDAVIEAPSADLAGKVKVVYSEAAPQ